MTRGGGRVAVVGAGFGGSLTALIAAKLGYEVSLFERGTLPRFAIGESSTPLAGLILADLCERYDLQGVRPLCSWGPWRRAYPGVGRGLKRGFTYFAHRPGEVLSDTPAHARSLLVAGSPDDERADTHWLRADVDAFLLGQAVDAGVRYRDRTEVRGLEAIDADLIVDASGRSGALVEALGARDATGLLRTHTRATWAHFEGVPPWPGAPRTPFDAESAAVHHLLDNAWMWALRFDHGPVSLGIVAPRGRTMRPWRDEVERFPSLSGWLAQARRTSALQTSGRLQRLVSPAAGRGWAMLPSAAGFVDPLHSAGIAHTLRGIERLARMLEVGPPPPGDLAAYAASVQREHLHIDRLVHGCYRRLAADDVRGLFAFAKLYFTAAVIAEERRRARRTAPAGDFLLANDDDFVSRLAAAERADADAVHDLLAPIDPIGLCAPRVPNRIPYEPPTRVGPEGFDPTLGK